MPIQYVGFENGKYLILEGDPGVRLNFEGPDAGKFAQVNVPDNPTQAVPFSLTLRECAKLGFIPQLKESLTLSDPRITASELTGPSDDPRQNGALEVALRMSLHEMAHMLLGKNTKDNRLADRIYQVIKTSVIDLAKEELWRRGDGLSNSIVARNRPCILAPALRLTLLVSSFLAF